MINISKIRTSFSSLLLVCVCFTAHAQVDGENCTTYIPGSHSGGYSPVVIRTPAGCEVSDVHQYNGSDRTWTQTEKNAMLSDWQSRNWSVEVVKWDKRQYNCHGYAWHMGAGGQPEVVMAESNWSAYDLYFEDGSYEEVNNESCATVVEYVSDKHTARTTSVPGVLISKWGTDSPLMRHKVNESPYHPQYGLKYYRPTDSTLRGEVIEGPSSFSASATYTKISGIQGNVTWHTNSTNLTKSANCNSGNSCTFTAASSGTAQVYFQVTDVCGKTYHSEYRTVSFTVPTSNVIDSRDLMFTVYDATMQGNDEGLCNEEQNYIEATYIGAGNPNILEYQWQMPGNWSYWKKTSSGFSYYVIPRVSGNTSGQVSVRVRNASGWSAWHSENIYTRDCGAGGEGDW